jgi:hypothetical protein
MRVDQIEQMTQQAEPDGSRMSLNVRADLVVQVRWCHDFVVQNVHFLV